MEMGKFTQGTNMINLKEAVTIMKRNNDGSIRSLMLIKKEEAENYADYWEQEDNESSQTIEELINGSTTIDRLLDKLLNKG